MVQGQVVNWLLLLIGIVNVTHSLEIFVTKTNNVADQDPVSRTNNRDESYEIPLFQRRYVTIRAHIDDLQRKRGNSDIIGFKFQVQVSNPNVVKIEKAAIPTSSSVNGKKPSTIVNEDLYILPKRNSLRQIFNTYPSPTLHFLNRMSLNETVIDVTWSVEGATMSITKLIFYLDVFHDNGNVTTFKWPLSFIVIQPKRLIDKLFFILVPIIVVCISILMGVLLETHVIFSYAKQPTPVIVGFISQYGLMPFLAMAIAKLFHYTPLYSLALFVIGCCPGSGASNQWTILFDGDVNLSAVMSFVSTAASFFMMPLYFFTIGALYMEELSISVPFLTLARSLALVVVPYAIGIGINHFFPNSRLHVSKFIKPIMISIVAFFLTFGVAVNWHSLGMIDIYTVLTAPLLPLLGFIFGGILASISRLKWAHVKTVSIEAGMQNVGIAFMIIMQSFPPPYSTQALIIPIIVSVMTPQPLWIALVIRNLYRKYQRKKEAEGPNMNDGKITISNERENQTDGEQTEKREATEQMQRL